MVPRLACVVVVVTAAVAFVEPSVAAAQTEAAGPEEVDAELDREARALFEAGRTAMRNGRHEEALEYFQRAYELTGRPELLFNIAVTADRLRKDELALDSFLAYLEELPDAHNRADVEARIEVLQARTAEEEPADSDAEPSEPAGPTGSDPPAPPTTAPEDDRAASQGSTPAVLLTSAGALAIGAAVSGALWKGRNDEVDQCKARPADCLNLGQLERQQRAVMGVTIGLAAAAVGLGIGGIVTATSSDSDRELACAPGWAAAVCSLRF